MNLSYLIILMVAETHCMDDIIIAAQWWLTPIGMSDTVLYEFRTFTNLQSFTNLALYELILI